MFLTAPAHSNNKSMAFNLLMPGYNVVDAAKTDPMNKKLAVNDASFIHPSAGKDQGTLIVIVKMGNTTGRLVPADIRVVIHGNDPVPSSFRGNQTGIPVRLHMGMYSVTALGPPGYTPVFSGDCSGGIMTVEIKKCLITNGPR